MGDNADHPGPVLNYATPLPQRIQVVTHADGISIFFPSGACTATVKAMMDFGDDAAEGCLLLVLAPFMVVGSAAWMMSWGVSLPALLILLVGVGALARFVVLLRRRSRGAELSVRGGQIRYSVPGPPPRGGLLRERPVADVIEILPGKTRPVIRLRGGNELLGGYDAIVVPGYGELPPEAKQRIVEMLTSAVGLAVR